MKPIGPSPGDDVRLANDRHRHWVPVLVVGVLLLIAYLWTDWIVRFPPPGRERWAGHPLFGLALTERGQLESQVWIHFPSELAAQDQRALLLLLTALGFLLAYYLPLRHKRQPLVLLTAAGIAIVAGPGSLGLFLAWHLLAFLTFHRPAAARPSTITSLSVLSFAAWLPAARPGWIGLGIYVLGAALTAPLSWAAYAYLYRPLLDGRARRWLQPGVANACLVYIAIAFAWQWLPGGTLFPRPLGWLLFFWQWERVLSYYLDLKDGRIPDGLGPWDYLATFLAPASLVNFMFLSRIPLGYAHVTRTFLARDKNRIVLSGLWLVVLSVIYLGLLDVVLGVFKLAMHRAFGVGHPYLYSGIVSAHRVGDGVGVLSVWTALIHSFVAFALLWAGYSHLKVGLWRLFGYDVERHFQRPFLATNFVDLWRRYSYYYREFLLRTFYLPLFLRWFKRQPRLRVFVATFAAAGFGNLVYHVVFRALAADVTPETLAIPLRRFPYYALLGGAIGLTQVWLLARGRRRRRPWTWGIGIALDVLAVVATLGFFALIRPLHHIPGDATVAEYARILLAAFGLGG